MNFQLDSLLLEKLPNFKVGIIHYTKFTNDTSPQMLKGRLQLFQEQLYFHLLDNTPLDIAGIAEWREVLTSLGVNHNIYPQSTELLAEQIAQQKYLQSVDSATDLTTFFSLQYEIPISIHDIDAISGNCIVKLGDSAANCYSRDEETTTLPNSIVIIDNQSIVSSPHVDAKRTTLSTKTTEAIQIFFLKPSMDSDEANELLTAAGNMFVTLSGGDFTTHLLHEAHTKTKIK